MNSHQSAGNGKKNHRNQGKKSVLKLFILREAGQLEYVEFLEDLVQRQNVVDVEEEPIADESVVALKFMKKVPKFNLDLAESKYMRKAKSEAENGEFFALYAL